MKRRKAVLFVPFILVVPLVAAAFVVGVVKAGPTSLYIQDVIDLGLGIGSQFTVDIMVDIIEYPGLWGAQFELTYNPDIIHGVSKEVNLVFLESWGGTATPIEGIGFNNTLGMLGLFSMFLMETGDPWVCPETYDPVWLARVTFEVVGLGESDITMGSSTRLKDPWGDEIPLDALDHGYFRNVDTTAIPQPSFTITPSEPLQGYDTTFTAEGNPASHRTIETYKWYFWKTIHVELFWPVISNVDVATRNYTKRGTWNVTLTVIDDTGVVGTTTGYVRIYSHDVAIIDIQANTTIGTYPTMRRVDIGQIIELNVTAQNQGDYPETFDVTAFWGAQIAGEMVHQIIDIEPDVALDAGANTTTTLYWDTEGRNLPHPSSFGIRANASVVPYEFDKERETGKITDNEYSGPAHRIRFHDVAVTSVTVNATSANPGDIIEIEATILNEGDYLEENIVVTALYDSNVIGIRIIPQMHNRSYSDTQLPGNHTATLTFLWDTTDVPSGAYIITAEISAVPDEYDTSDNTFIDGKVRWVGVPVASFTYSPFEPVASETVTFNASLSSDEDGTIVSYSWDFGDDWHAEGIVAQHAYAADGTYVVALTVTDNDGTSDTITETIEVITPPPGEYLADLVKRSAWPSRHHFNPAAHGQFNTLYGKVKNLGNSPVNAKVIFSIYSIYSGELVGTLQTSEYKLAVGEERDFAANFDTDASGLAKFYVKAQCWFDSNGNNTIDEPGEKVKPFRFSVVKVGGSGLAIPRALKKQ